MLRRLFRLVVTVGIVGGVVVLVRKVLAGDEPAASPAVPPLPREEWPPLEPAAAPAAWVEPVEGGCPATHPVKAKMASKIFHVPGGQSYERTKPDRCYRDAAAAEADGLRAAKR